MAKKKVKKTSSAKSKKSHGELFDKHPNLIWLLPVFLIIAAVAVIVIWNDFNGSTSQVVAIDEKIMIDDATLESTTDVTDELIVEN